LTLATSVQNTIRKLIDRQNFISSSASLYSFASATKSYDEEGGVTVTDWGTPTSISVISSSDEKNIRKKDTQGEERIGQIVFLIRDDVTIAQKDRVDFNSISYFVDDIENVAEMDNLIIGKRIRCHRDD